MVLFKLHITIPKEVRPTRLTFVAILFLSLNYLSAQQGISDFVSLGPLPESTDYRIPESHVFQYIIAAGDPLSEGGLLPNRNDFTAYVAINGSSENGYLSINSERIPGGVSILDINFDSTSKIWVLPHQKLSILAE